ncbi:hypothetical protein AAG570_004172 [Ranatra chinensis]|uniref:Hsp70-binding protein 1 n=1 Tax=Ranatra chinensis TaxID=642074 RepID=A0ABD0YL47_9HEMI
MTVDIIKELSVALGTLNSMKESNSSFDDTSPYANALDTILEYVDNLDIANDFIKLNGFAALSICLRCPWEDLRWRAAEAIAVCCQNNPTCQAKALEDNLLQPLLKMAENDPNDECKIKAFYAVSCIVRESEQGLAKFISLDGLSFMLRVMQLTIVKLQIKASFFLSTLVSRHPELKDSLYKMGFVEQLVALIQSEHSQAHEHIISSLLLLITDFQPAIIECRRPELHLQSCLVRLAQELRKEEAYRVRSPEYYIF